jgi:hypothetical protein
MLDRLTLQDFEGCTDSLALAAGEVRVPLRLVESAALANPSPRAAPPFRLLLEAGDGFAGPQGLYRLLHPTLGALDVFLVPVSRSGAATRYEAIFN